MPIYEFSCTACARSFESLLALGAPARTPCPRCARPARRIASGFAVKTHAKSAAPEDAPARGARGRRRKRVELPADVPRPGFSLGEPPPLPRRYVEQIRHHGHC